MELKLGITHTPAAAIIILCIGMWQILSWISEGQSFKKALLGSSLLLYHYSLPSPLLKYNFTPIRRSE